VGPALRAANPDPARAAKDILVDLENGAASVLLAVDPTGVDGVAIGSAEDMAKALDNVLIDLATVALDAGYLGPKAADWLGSLAKAAPNAPVAFHMDPLTTFATTGFSPGPVEAHIFNAANVGARLAGTYAKASVFLATGRAAHEAGGSNTEELALMAASALAYAKALVRAGLSMEEAFKRITLGVSLDGEYFTGVAKIRAARALWARLTQACGVGVPAAIEARSSGRMLTTKDAWTNLLRLTSAGFAGAVGGADAIVLGAFTDAIGLPTAFGRRPYPQRHRARRLPARTPTRPCMSTSPGRSGNMPGLLHVAWKIPTPSIGRNLAAGTEGPLGRLRSRHPSRL
jgi:methylmalonyl-CoA mutase